MFRLQLFPFSSIDVNCNSLIWSWIILCWAITVSLSSLINSNRIGRQNLVDEERGFFHNTRESHWINNGTSEVIKMLLSVESDDSKICLYWLWPEAPSKPHLYWTSIFVPFANSSSSHDSTNLEILIFFRYSSSVVNQYIFLQYFDNRHIREIVQ